MYFLLFCYLFYDSIFEIIFSLMRLKSCFSSDFSIDCCLLGSDSFKLIFEFRFQSIISLKIQCNSCILIVDWILCYIFLIPSIDSNRFRLRTFVLSLISEKQIPSLKNLDFCSLSFGDKKRLVVNRLISC